MKIESHGPIGVRLHVEDYAEDEDGFFDENAMTLALGLGDQVVELLNRIHASHRNVVVRGRWVILVAPWTPRVRNAVVDFLMEADDDADR